MAKFDPKWTRQQLEDAKELWLGGKTATQVADVVGKSRSAVVGKMKRLGLLKKEQGIALPKGAPRSVKKSKLPLPPMELPPVIVPEASSLNPVTLENLRKHHCRAILGDVGPEGFAMYCGDPKAEGSSYCSFHHGLYTQPLTVRVRHGETRQR